MPDFKTPYAGIIIRTRDGVDSDKFPRMVRTALFMINSEPTGRRLLELIVARAGQAMFGNASAGHLAYTVCIMPKKSIKHARLSGTIRWREYERGNVTLPSNEARASTPNQGTVSGIRWDPLHNSTPDGSRPPFIGLAHELIHAWRNLYGISYIRMGTGTLGTNFNNSEDATNVDEMKVVGLRGFEQELITENRIRKEHGLPYRTSYFGRCSAAEGAPDTGQSGLGGPATNNPSFGAPPQNAPLPQAIFDPIGI
jgi:hypothetical protein